MPRRPLKWLAVALLAPALAAAGCAKPQAAASPNPEASALAGLWEQFVPVESMPTELELTPGGAALSDGGTGQWKLSGDVLTVKTAGEQTAYSFTRSGYMLTLFNLRTETSAFYINPALFAEGADGNAALEGRWAGFSTFGKMDLDGKGKLTSTVYTTAGRVALPQEYAARDGILQTVDADGNHTYNLYEISEDGALLLAETSEYDKDARQWSAWWKRAEPDEALLTAWTRAVDANPGGGLPASLRLMPGGEGAASADAGGAPADIRWEYYNGGFLLIEYAETNLQYAWCARDGAALYLGNPEVSEAWYIDESKFTPAAAPLAHIGGAWASEDGEVNVRIDAAGTVAFNGGPAMPVAAGDGLLKLDYGGKAYYMAYVSDGETMKLYYGEQPFLEGREMPVELSKQ